MQINRVDKQWVSNNNVVNKRKLSASANKILVGYHCDFVKGKSAANTQSKANN